MNLRNPLVKSLGLVLAVLGCGSPETNQEPAEPTIIRPNRVQELGLEYSTTEAAMLGTESSQLPIGRAGPLSLTGGASGLYEISSGGLVQIDTTAVTAIAKYGSGLVVGNANGLFVYNGTLTQSPITEALNGAKITALAVRMDQLWIGTEQGLYLYFDETLHSFDDTMNVFGLNTYDKADDVVVDTASGYQVYRKTDDAWTLLALDGEVEINMLVPSTNGRIIGLSNGVLLQRVALEDDKASWRAVATTDSATDPGARGIESIATDPSTGAVWIIEASHLARLDPNEGDVSRLTRPSTIGAVQSIGVSADGTLWIYDGNQVHELGQDGELVTYSTIQAMSAASCDSCHKTLGTAPMALDSYDNWVSYVDKIIERMDSESMPPPGTALIGGSADTVRQWKALGMPQ